MKNKRTSSLLEFTEEELREKLHRIERLLSLKIHIKGRELLYIRRHNIRKALLQRQEENRKGAIEHADS